jgi:hypothetical protein
MLALGTPLNAFSEWKICYKSAADRLPSPFQPASGKGAGRRRGSASGQFKPH